MPETEIGKIATIPLMLIGIGVGFYIIFAIQDYGRSRVDLLAKQVEGQLDDRKKK